MKRDYLGMAKRALQKPPGEVAKRILKAINTRTERYFAPIRANRFDEKTFLKAVGEPDMDTAWSNTAARSYPAFTDNLDKDVYESLCPGQSDRVLKSAYEAMSYTIDILGSGPVDLGDDIDWMKDHKTGHRWPPAYIYDIDYMNPDRDSDVKMAWDLSRQQWLIPLGQAYLLTRDEQYAVKAKNIITDWIEKNRYAMTVNWAIAMEAAMRIFTYTWLFHVFANSRSWKDTEFRSMFLRSIYLHGDFIQRHLERAYINGNHYLSNGAGLVFAGLFFDRDSWATKGFTILKEELDIQVFDDGADYEASVPYHRLVTELFLFPAIYMQRAGKNVPENYRDKLLKMAKFIVAYTRPDGLSPKQGDADDARVLPFGGQTINDHRYLPGLIGAAFGYADLHAGPKDELLFTFGPETARQTPDNDTNNESAEFRESGCYIMGGGNSHVFIDCGPVGLAGYGGHGHNDCLSFEAYLNGAPVVTDSGSYVYTASYEWHNRFRSTRFHNTPFIDGEEINRFVDPAMLWSLENDAIPEVIRWKKGATVDLFRGAHTGYMRLASPVKPVRTIALDKVGNRLAVADSFTGEGEHDVIVPFTLDPSVTVTEEEKGELKLTSGGVELLFVYGGADEWSLKLAEGYVSESYGLKEKTVRIELTHKGPLAPLITAIAPYGSADDLLIWAGDITK